MYYTSEIITKGGTLGQLLHFANNCKDKIIDQNAIPYGLTSAQYKILLHIVFRKLTTPMALSQALHIDNVAITCLLDRLEQKGRLIRTRDKHDRRQINIILTEHGKQKSKKIPDIAVNALNQLTNQLSHAEIMQLEVLLKKLLLSNGYSLNDFEQNDIDESNDNRTNKR